VYYTDGLTDAENPQGEAYGEQRLAQAIQRHAGKLTAVELRDAIIQDVVKFCDGTPPFDDLTMLVVRYTGS
jgi:phosphoserine phosphatase RsbU/P